MELSTSAPLSKHMVPVLRGVGNGDLYLCASILSYGSGTKRCKGMELSTSAPLS
jgi:hypothetical protein